VKNIAFISGYTRPAWPWQLLFELSYGLDFVSIELLFRGFLVIGLARWLGADVLLPMAVFYCTIHFGKPLGECIFSFFGGLALGMIALRTRSIMGGLMVHLGLAWMMEAGGWLGNLYF
jgi:membrane protease YdiL (CAAX protease family)